MISSSRLAAILRRLSAVLLIAAPLISWPFLPAALRANYAVLAVSFLSAAAGVALLTRRAGCVIGMGAGAVSGIALAIVLAPAIPGMPAWAGMAAVAAVFGVIGHLSGFGRPVSIRLPERIAPSQVGSSAAPPPRLSSPNGGTLSGSRNATVNESLAGVLEELCRFLHRETDYQRAARAPTWTEFNQFVRDGLRARLGAVGVNIYRLSDDYERLLPLDWNGAAAEQLPSARDGVIGWVVSSGKLFIGDGQAAPDGSASRWAWLLPLMMNDRVHAIVAVDQFTRPEFSVLHVASAVRDQLQLVWTSVAALQALEFAERSASTRGLVSRGELLTVIDRAIREAKLSGEVVTLLTVAIEGVRKLDDEGFWAERDHLTEHIGLYVRTQIGADHAVGRFSDDRFVVVIRRMDTYAAGQLAARVHAAAVTKLSGELERLAGPREGSASPSLHQIRIRAATAGCEFTDVPDWRPFGGELMGAPGSGPEQQTLKLMSPAARDILLRCFSLLEFARRERLDIVHDTMQRLPEPLRRPRGRGDSSAGVAPQPRDMPPPTGAPR